MNRFAFEQYLRETTRDDTGTIKSYVRGMDLIPEMIQKQDAGFLDCADIWNLKSIPRVHELLEKVRQEQALKEQSIWYLEGKKSYLQKGFIKAALGHYRHFLLENLSATYDKARCPELVEGFDQHLITFDEDYRMVVSTEIREHYRNDNAKELFEKREGQMIYMPANQDRRPLQDYLEVHRQWVG